MICWHRRYSLGDEHSYDCDEFFRELAFEADDDLDDQVYRLENAVWERLFSYTGSADRANFLIDNKVSDMVDRAVSSGYLILPIYLYDHSGITISVGPFACPWDSGQAGWIICDNETIDKDFNGDRDLAEKALRAEVKLYDDYLTGNVYGFIVEEWDGETWEHVDSCFGFFGDDIHTNGIADHLDSDLIDLAENAEVEYPN